MSSKSSSDSFLTDDGEPIAILAPAKLFVISNNAKVCFDLTLFGSATPDIT
jgi:hypothetical protein